MQIRSTRTADVAALTAVFGDEDFFLDRLHRQDADLGVLLTGWLHREPVAVVYLWLEDAEEVEIRTHLPKVPLLMHVEVREDLRNRGLGTMLMNEAERRLAERGYDRVALAVRTDNDGAHRLYNRLGYEEWPHSEVECMYEVTLADGRRTRCPEMCHILVKKLLDSSA